MAKRIGSFAPKQVPNAPNSFNEFVLKQTGYSERLGIIPAEIAPSRLNSIRQNAACGGMNELYELYDKMIASDARIGGIVGSLLSTISGLPVKINKARGTNAREESLAEDYKGVVEEALNNIDLHSLIKELASTYIVGAKILQWNWMIESYPRGNFLALPKEIKPIADGSILMEMLDDSNKYGELKIITRTNTEGVYVSDLDPRRIMVVEDGYSKGKYDTKGALRRVLGWWITKMYAQLWWAEYSENFGQPTRIGSVTREATPNEKAELKRFLAMVGRNKWGVFPEGMNIKLLEANQQGTVLTFQQLINMANNEIAVALIGQTGITQDSAQGSRAKLQVLDGVRIEIIKNIAAIVTKGMKHLVHQILRVNYGDDCIKRLAPSVVPFVARPEAIKEKVDYFVALSASGFPVPMDEIVAETGICEPEEGQKVLLNGNIVDWDPNAEPQDNGNSNDTPEEGEPVQSAGTTESGESSSR